MMSRKKIDLEIHRLGKQPNIDSFLYRYITIDKLLDFLINKRLPLTRLNIFEDKLEGITPKHLLLNLASTRHAEEIGKQYENTLEGISISVNSTERNDLRRQREDFQERNFANCWFIGEHESVAMWQLYSKPDSVVIKIEYKLLMQEISSENFNYSANYYTSLTYGKTQYCRFTDWQELKAKEGEENLQGFLKDKSFEHEQEFRLILQKIKTNDSVVPRKEGIPDEKIDEFNRQRSPKVVYLNFLKFEDMRFEIIFNPKSQDWHRKNVEGIIQKYNLGFKTKVSDLVDIFKY